MEEQFRNIVKEYQDGEISLEEAIFSANNLLVTCGVDETSSDEIEHWSEQCEKLNELLVDIWMKSKGYEITSDGLYIKSESHSNLEF